MASPLVIPGWCEGVVVLLQRLLGRSNLGSTDWVDWVGVKANKWLHDMPGYLRQLAGMSGPLIALSIYVVSCHVLL